MKSIKNWVNNLRLNRKIIFYGYLFLTPVFLFICSFLVLDNYNNSMKKEISNNLENVKSLSDSVKVIQNKVYDLSTYICINNEINTILKSSDPQSLSGGVKVWNSQAPMRFVQDIVALEGYIKTIAIYPENGVPPFLRCIDDSSYLSTIEEVRETPYYQYEKSQLGVPIWRSVPKNSTGTYRFNRSDKLVLYREIYDLSKKNPLGYLMIGISEEKILNLFKGTTKEDTEGILILSNDGEDLVKYGAVNDDVFNYLKGCNLQGNNYINYKQYQVFYYQDSEETSSIVCKIIQRQQLGFLDFAYMPLLLLFGLLLGFWPLLVIISRVITKPLSKVCVAIKNFSKGDFSQQVTVKTNDEIGEVARCFNKMFNDIKELIETNYVITLREKESELAALQSQINPHFLYNTLDSLYWLANDSANDAIAEYILALSKLFRLMLNQGKGVCTVSQEIELISNYLKIQKIRFCERLVYKIDIQDEIVNAPIPHLILQPFVENAIVHGLENISTTCYITVTGRLKGSYIEFEISDTGIGMNQLQIDEILKGTNAKRYNEKIGSYAIKNIIERLELTYQKRYTLMIHSKIDKGTTITLAIPFEEGVN